MDSWADVLAPVPPFLPPEYDASDLDSIIRGIARFLRNGEPAEDVESSPCFRAGVALLGTPEFSGSKRATLLRDGASATRCLVLAAIAAGHDVTGGSRLVWRLIPVLDATELHFALLALERADHRRHLATRVLVRARKAWAEENAQSCIRVFLKRRVAVGDVVVPGILLARCSLPWLAAVGRITRGCPEPGLQRLHRRCRTRLRQHAAMTFLRSQGQFLPGVANPGAASITETSILQRSVAELVRSLTGTDGPQSCLVVGDRGVGKTTIVHSFWRQVAGGGWRVVGIDANRLVAGKRHIGDVEEAVQDLVFALRSSKRVVWYIPDFSQLQWAGRHSHSAVSVLDMILPHIKAQQITILGEITTDAHERLQRRQPAVLAALRAIRVTSPSVTEIRAIVAGQWRAGVPNAADMPVETIDRLVSLVSRFGPVRNQPGGAVALLQQAIRDRPEGASERGFDVIAAVSGLLGLSSGPCDPIRRFDASSLRRRMRGRIIGQPQAVDAVVDRIALMRHGLTEPGRPFGVFLLAGPSGTGKTELARQTAKAILGSEDRLIRLDMSEFGLPNSRGRLLETSTEDDGDTGSLMSRVRQRPLSVILLDEVEKAHPSVWDVFLQVFDCGRLTDNSGNTVHFDASFVFMTTNLGATEAGRAAVGFDLSRNSFDESRIHESLSAYFRPELLNRIDSVMVFHPLSSSHLRAILERELRDLRTRPGFASAGLRLHVDDSAKDLLLLRGYSPRAGARGLRKAIEGLLLMPLALYLDTLPKHRQQGGIFITRGAAGLEFKGQADARSGGTLPRAA